MIRRGGSGRLIFTQLFDWQAAYVKYTAVR